LQEGTVVEGSIDWDRRLDLMQQHTGEHILSGLIFERYGYHNVGFHVGAVAMEVDFDGPIPAEELQELEQQANRIVWQNLALKCFTPAPQELEKTVYRTKRALPWPVRIVQVPGVDSCACCGVHVQFTGQVGLIKILSAAKFHGGIRLQMVCGNRAYNYMNRIFEENRGVSQLLSAQMTQTLDAVKQLQQICESTKYKLVQMQDQHLRQVAESVKGISFPVVFEPDLTGGQLRDLTEMMAQNSFMAVACTGSDDTGYQICLVGSGAVEIGTEAMKCLSGRGGGKNGAFQGRVTCTRKMIECFLESCYDRGINP
jgi:alanyl-tRNA synthetase